MTASNSHRFIHSVLGLEFFLSIGAKYRIVVLLYSVYYPLDATFACAVVCSGQCTTEKKSKMNDDFQFVGRFWISNLPETYSCISSLCWWANNLWFGMILSVKVRHLSWVLKTYTINFCSVVVQSLHRPYCENSLKEQLSSISKRNRMSINLFLFIRYNGRLMNTRIWSLFNTTLWPRV